MFGAYKYTKYNILCEKCNNNAFDDKDLLLRVRNRY